MTEAINLPSSKNALIIFTRNPELGKCKTRLAKTIGNTAALNIYKHLLNHTVTIASPVNAHKFVFYSENIAPKDIWDTAIFNKQLQYGGHLGERMEHAFRLCFNLGYKNVVIIGSDVLDLTTPLINNAFEALSHHPFVIGPAQDGGYYLLGMTQLYTPLFMSKNWGTETVLQDTLANLKNFEVHLLEEISDIDTFEDLKSYPELNIYYR